MTSERITQPGKFEGEMSYVLYFWNCCLEGMWDEDIDGTFFIPFDKDDRAKFPTLDGVYGMALWESEQGFVYTREFASMKDYQDAIEMLENE